MAVKQARIRAHEAFDRLWREGGMHRNEAYGWLAKAMGMSRENCHIGALGLEQCAVVVTLATNKLQSIRSDPLRGDRDMVRAIMREKFGHGKRAARKARLWLGDVLRLEGRALVHELDEEQCRYALAQLEALASDCNDATSSEHDAFTSATAPLNERS